ncbi:methyltransferase domain-containing protein [Actinomadura logoneensis]|nr:methyltransferase domain-containing protein [Actinomadura logoneensis]
MTNSLIDVLDAADMTPEAVRLRAHSYDLLRATSVVDVGCGTGRAVAELAERGVRATGVDLDEQMIAVARTRHPDADFRVASAEALPLPDASVDGYRADKVFHALHDPAEALTEARRVLTPGGRVVLLGQDWDTLVIDSDAPSLTRTIVHARADMIASPRAARRSRNLLLDAGFQDVATEVRTGVITDASMFPLLSGLAEASRATGAITGAQADAWLADQRHRAATDRLFLAVPIFITTATTP